MTGKFAAISLVLTLVAGIGTSLAEERKKMELLDPADGPCLFLLDEDLNEIGSPVNPPCDLGTIVVNAGDPISAEDRQKYGQPAPTSGTTDETTAEATTEATEEATDSTREAGSGMATGRREH